MAQDVGWICARKLANVSISEEVADVNTENGSSFNFNLWNNEHTRSLTGSRLFFSASCTSGWATAAARIAFIFLQTSMVFSSSPNTFILINPTAWSAKLRSDIIHLAGFFQELKGGVCTAIRQSKLRARNRAINESCTERKLTGWSGPPSVYNSSIGFVSLCRVRRELSSVAWHEG